MKICKWLLTSLFAQVRAINAKLPQDDRESAITTIEHFGPPPDAYQAYIQENGVASVLAMYYTLQNGMDLIESVAVFWAEHSIFGMFEQ